MTATHPIKEGDIKQEENVHNMGGKSGKITYSMLQGYHGRNPLYYNVYGPVLHKLSKIKLVEAYRLCSVAD